MLESLEGKQGIVRYKPPLPAIEGLFGRPTVVNNVVTLASVPNIISMGAERYASYGVNRSRGTLAFQLAGNVRRGGLVEKGFGITVRELIEDFGGGTASGRPVKAVQVGGPLGAYLPAEQLDTPLDYEAFKAIGGVLGHGGIVVFDEATDLGEMARFAMEFCCEESKTDLAELAVLVGAGSAGEDESSQQQVSKLRHGVHWLASLGCSGGAPSRQKISGSMTSS